MNQFSSSVNIINQSSLGHDDILVSPEKCSKIIYPGKSLHLLKKSMNLLENADILGKMSERSSIINMHNPKI